MQNFESLRTLESQVRHILRSYPETRNSDLKLQAQLVYDFYPALEQPIYDWREIVHAMSHVPSLDHIARVRRKVVEKYHDYYPTDPKVAKARKVSEDTWKAYMMGLDKPREIIGSNIPVEHERAYSRDEL